MHYALIADIHANLAALEAVFGDIGRRGGVSEVWCLGDIVGYGPDPRECIELVARGCDTVIAGNHDRAAIGKLDLGAFNPDAIVASRWTAGQLSPADISYLDSLPQLVIKGDFTLVHGSPRQPLWEYLVSVASARENFAYFNSQYCLVGHSHQPGVFRLADDGECYFDPLVDYIGRMLGEERLIINPGSVGQPRDGDPRASYAILDAETGMLRCHRVAYDITRTQLKMTSHNLPVSLIARLKQGL